MEAGVKFSPGRLTKQQSELGQSVELLASMIFKEIYHDSSVGSMGTPGWDTILFARHAEALVRNRLTFHHLKHIVCRSAPERDTLLNLLNHEVRDRWIKRIQVDDSYRRLFHRDMGAFVRETHLTAQRSQFTFQPCARYPRGPFLLRIERTGRFQNYEFELKNFQTPNAPLEVGFPEGTSEPEYSVKLWLNDDMAYIGKFRSEDPLLDPF